MSECPFCLGNNLLQSNILFQDDLWFFTDINPNEGSNSGLAVTRRHIQTPFEITAEEWQRLHQLLPKFKNFIDARETPHGYNLGWNVLPVGGQTVQHAHLHIAARYDDEEMAGKGIRYHFKKVRNKRSSED